MKKIIREQREKTHTKTLGNEDNHKRNEEQHAKNKQDMKKIIREKNKKEKTTIRHE